MPTSDKEVEKLQSSVEKKREQVAKVQAQRVQRESELNNDIVAAQLEAEEARLDAQLAEEKVYASAASVKDGASATLDVAKENMRLAHERQRGQEALVEARAEEKKNTSTSEEN